MGIIKKMLIWLGLRCECGGKLEDQGNGYRQQCVKCGRIYKYF